MQKVHWEKKTTGLTCLLVGERADLSVKKVERENNSNRKTGEIHYLSFEGKTSGKV